MEGELIGGGETWQRERDMESSQFAFTGRSLLQCAASCLQKREASGKRWVKEFISMDSCAV